MRASSLDVQGRQHAEAEVAQGHTWRIASLFPDIVTLSFHFFILSICGSLRSRRAATSSSPLPARSYAEVAQVPLNAVRGLCLVSPRQTLYMNTRTYRPHQAPSAFCVSRVYSHFCVATVVLQAHSVLHTVCSQEMFLKVTMVTGVEVEAL